MSVRVEPIWFTTGNPFVDTGQEMMAAMAKVDSADELTKDDVEPLLSRLTDLYMLEKWRKSLQSIFPNSKLTNPSVKRKAEEYSKLLEAWFQQVGSDKRINATCAISGKPAQVYVSKVYLPLSDFEAGNFQSGNEAGVPLSAPIALGLQFFPLGLVKVGKMMALPHFSNHEVEGLWADERIEHIEESETLNTGGVQDLGTSRPANAFFRLVENLVGKHKESLNSSVTLYLFNNFNQVDYKHAAELHYMPSPVFRFISAAMNHSNGEPWHRIVRRGYRTKKEIEDENEALRRFDNIVYSKLLRDESISAFFLDGGGVVQ